MARSDRWMVARFGTKVGQIGYKWDKFGIFSDQISVNFGNKSDL